MSVAVPQLMSSDRSVNATDVAPIHWPSVVTGLFLAVCVVVGVSWLASPKRVDRPMVAAASSATAPAPAVAPTPIPPPPIAAPEPTPAPERVKVAFTNGSSLVLRAKPGQGGPRLKTVSEGSTLDVIGDDQTVDGLTWRNVRDAAGTSGWVAGKFVARLQP